MRVEIIIDSNKEEKATIVAKEMTSKIEHAKSILESDSEFTCYDNEIIKKVNLFDVVSVFVTDGKTYITTKSGEYLIKMRLYQVEELLNESFVKINQSCIINIKEIEEFKVSLNGSLKVIMKNRFEDYISRRELKKVKEKIGL